MPYLSDFTNKEAYSNQVEIAGIASVIHEDTINQATYPNHCELSTSGTQTILAVYNDVTNSKGMLRIGTRISDFAIEWGNAQEFYASAVKHIIPIRLSDTKFAIVFSQNSDDDGYIIAGTVAGTVATLGSAVEFADATTCVTIGAELLETDKVLIAYQNSTTNQRAVCVTFSGTVATVGTPATINSTIDNATYYSYQQLAIHSTTLATVVYRVSATVTEAVTLSISGTTITVNTAGKAAFGGSADIRYPAIGALSSTAFVIAYTDVTDTGKGNAQIGTIATTTITAGANEYNFNASNLSDRRNTIAVCSSTLFAICHYSSLSSQYFSIIMGSVNATVIAFGSSNNINSANNYQYPYAKTGYDYVKITNNANNEITFTYLSSITALNQYIAGMIDYTGIRLNAIREMCFKIAQAGSNEQIEISSLYVRTLLTLGSNNTFLLYLNGTTNNKCILNSSTNNQFNPTSTGALSLILNLANNPIILKNNETLYFAIRAQNQSLANTCTVFGLKRS